MKNNLAALPLVLALSLVISAQAGAQERTGIERSFLDEPVSIKLKNINQGFFLRIFSKRTGIKIGFCRILEWSKKDDPQLKINIAVEQGTIRDVLDSFVEADPRYKWVALEENVINVIPKRQVSLLSTVVEKVHFQDVTKNNVDFFILELPRVKRVLEDMGVSRAVLRTYYGTWDASPPRFSLELTSVNVQQILNDILRKDHASFWIIERYGRNQQFIKIHFH